MRTKKTDTDPTNTDTPTADTAKRERDPIRTLAAVAASTAIEHRKLRKMTDVLRAKLAEAEAKLADAWKVAQAAQAEYLAALNPQDPSA